MLQEDSEFLTRARHARDKLVDQFINHPDVSLIDVGYASERGEKTEEVVLRIHVRERWMKAKPLERVAFPKQVDDIPVVVMLGDYQLETDAPAVAKELNHPDSTTRSTGMGPEENVAALAYDQPDDLKAIKGIRLKRADALRRIGIHRFEDLAGYTPDELSKALRKQAGMKVSLRTIETQNWIGQAKDLARLRNPLRTSPEGGAGVEREPQQAPLKRKKEWEEQHPGFSVFFDYKVDEHGEPVIDEHGERVWQTRVYDGKSGVEELLPGLDTASWVNWILERAKLPVAPEPIPTGPEVAVPPALVTPYDAQIEVLGVKVSEIGPSPSVPEKRLIAEVRFQVSGSEAETLTADRIPFRVEVHTVDLESRASNLVVSRQSQLQSQVFEYTSQQEFPIPELGRHELHSVVLLLPPGEMMAYHRGPILKVVP